MHYQKQMAVQITNITYKHYIWADSLSELEVQLLSVKELLNLQQQKVSAKEAIRICEEYNQRCYMHFFFERPIEELVAIRTFALFPTSTHNRQLFFDALCNMWNFISEADIHRYYTLQPIHQRLFYEEIKDRFIYWYCEYNTMNYKQRRKLYDALSLPIQFRLNNVNKSYVFVNYMQV